MSLLFDWVIYGGVMKKIINGPWKYIQCALVTAVVTSS